MKPEINMEGKRWIRKGLADLAWVWQEEDVAVSRMPALLLVVWARLLPEEKLGGLVG